MSKRNVLLLVMSALLSSPLHSNELNSKVKLLIDVKRIKSLKGKLHVNLFTINGSETEWQDIKSVKRVVLDVNSYDFQVEFSDLEIGKYGIRMYQDINDNEILDLTDNGFPMEPIGFSTNPSLMRGQPSAGDVLFDLTAETKLNVVLKHRKARQK